MVTRSDTTLGRISKPRYDEILGYGIRGRRNPISLMPFRRRSRGGSTRRCPSRSARHARRPSTTTNSNARFRRGSDCASSNTSSLSIKLRLQVSSYCVVSMSTRILHDIVLVIGFKRTLRRIGHSLAFRKAIRSVLAATTTTLTRHLQKRQQQAIPRVRKIRYTSYSKKKKKKKKKKKHTVIKIMQIEEKRTIKQTIFPRPLDEFPNRV
jgi:hypothetical protein